jgi:hypothetical protein
MKGHCDSKTAILYKKGRTFRQERWPDLFLTISILELNADPTPFKPDTAGKRKDDFSVF